ncbi:C2 family cysteine protease [Urbifossiella limnaea]|uniref:Leukotoxin n=1 Tax=Urbifossiella limnaea TaxID=2528023 RepID=A0A517Y1V5_9BACT|nr:C2 family cysteine protease [Urbifossiella limnaea]QDU23737.1 Leukotoxin [Urbifossiella limnaea]
MAAKTSRKLGFEPLEVREVPAVLSAYLAGQDLIVQMDNAGGGAEVRQAGTTVTVTEPGTTRSWSYPASWLRSLNFYGGEGNDRFVNHTGIGSAAFGYGGNDVFVGGGGNDALDGGEGHDRLNGRGGADNLYGGNGNDVLIGIDAGGPDYLDPWGGRDVIWAETNDQLSPYVGTDDVVQRMSGFANAADRTLDGDRILDPVVAAGQTYRAFAGNPLFAAAGPRVQDMDQGALGDCWLVSGLGTVAKHDPMAVRGRVVDFDDGTYGVRLGNNFYRVDNDLPVAVGGATPVNAGFGAENSMWVAVAEKAYAHFRTAGANSYASLQGGRAAEVYQAFGSTNAVTSNFADYGSATALANEMYRRFAAGEMLSIGTGVAKAPGLDVGATVDGHAYVVTSVNRGWVWNSTTRSYSLQVTSITLRNPWGDDGTAGSATVTVTPEQLFNRAGRFYAGTL